MISTKISIRRVITPVTIPITVLALVVPPKFSEIFMATTVARELAATFTILVPIKIVTRSLLESLRMASSLVIFFSTASLSDVFFSAWIFSGLNENSAISDPEKKAESASSKNSMGNSSI